MGGFRWVSLRVPMDGSVVVDLAVTVGGWVCGTLLLGGVFYFYFFVLIIYREFFNLF